MKRILQKIRSIFKDPIIKKKIIFTFFILFVFRIFAFLPVPAVDIARLRTLFSQNQFLALLDIFSGGTLINFSVMALGLGPYINASIIIQLLSVVMPQLEALAKEGEYGRAKINQYTRFLTAPITILQGIGMYVLLRNQKVIANLSFIEFIAFILTMLAGTYILMWFGELISEFGLGNGISLLIFAGIVARIPTVSIQTVTTVNRETFFNVGLFLIMGIVVVTAVVFINEAVRKIPIYYAKRIKGNRVYQGATNFLPLKLNQAGVIPIIFAVSFVLFPQLLGNFLRYVKNDVVARVASFLTVAFNPSGFFYNFFYFILVVAFTYFYTIIVFNPQKIADEIQKHGGFIPGIRPGTATKMYLQSILYKITTVGAVFLGIIAVFPSLVSRATGSQNLIIGGTGVLIVVSVVLETFKMLEAQLMMKSYDKLTS
ncbi:MAG TPA: preprotein translocase subunit SecY [Patescibacteria group bacterium]|nr:preprotein translocase subunit SecY [Patescibacteria group bacterium]